MARSHIVLGLATWIAAAPLLHLAPFAPAYLGLAMAGALLPDVDHPKSWVGRRSRPLSTIVAAVFGHRGVTHSAIAVLSLVALLTYADYRRGTVSALGLGYLSHLAADMLTPQGLPLAWPFRKSWAFPVCRTGSPTESLVVLVICAATCWLVVHRIG
jgi:inner membrane protein